MNTAEYLKIMDIVKGFIEIIERLRSDGITEEIYKKRIKPMLTSSRRFLNYERFELENGSILPYDSFERVQVRSEGLFVDDVLQETIKRLEKDIVKDKE